MIVRMKANPHFFGLLGVVLLASASIANAKDYRNEAFHFGFSPPPGWEEMVAADLEVINNFTRSKLATEYTTGFRPRGKGPGTTPYILVQVNHADMSKVTFAEIEKEFGTGMEEGMKEAQEKISDIAKDVRAGQAIVDRKNRRVILRYNMNVAGENMDGISFGAIGSPGMAFIHCYDLSGNFAAMLPTFSAVADSVRFDPGYTFHPSDAPAAEAVPGGAGAAAATPSASGSGGATGSSPAKPSFWSGVGRSALIGAVIGVVAAVTLALIRRLMKKKQSPPPGPGTS